MHDLLLVVCTIGIQAAPPPPDGAPPAGAAASLGDLAARAQREAGAPALGLAVVRGADEPLVAVSGLRMAGTDAPVTIDDRWHWGSVTKSMTATLAGRLVESETVDWADTVGEVLGDEVPDMLDAYRDVTLAHLLTHRSGLPANIPIERFAEFAATPEDPVADRLAWVHIALAQEPRGPKEETYEYSNNGYVVAGAMLEAVTGRSWEDLMRREVFEPLGLESAGFGAPAGPGPADQPRGHVAVEGSDTPVPPHTDNPPALGPAGRVHMSLADMATYLSAHATGRGDFLEKATYERLHSRPFGGIYAHGWVVTGPQGRWHNGSNTTWYAEVAFDLDDATAAAVVVNDGDIASVQPAVRSLLQQLMRRDDRDAVTNPVR